MSSPAPRRRGRHASPEDGVPAAWFLDSDRDRTADRTADRGVDRTGRPADRHQAAEGTARLPGVRATRPGPPPPTRVAGLVPAHALPRTIEADLAALQARHRGEHDPVERYDGSRAEPARDRWDADPRDDGRWDDGRWDRAYDTDPGPGGFGLPPTHDRLDDRRDDRRDDQRNDSWDDAWDDGHGDGHRDDHHGDHDDDEHDDFDYDAVPFYDEVEGPRRRRRRPVSIILSLLVLAAVIVGVAVGGKAVYERVNPTAKDYDGAGTGSVQVRVQNGDTLSDIGRTLVSSGVVASAKPFLQAANGQPAATGIQPGVYGLRQHMSGASALQLLLDPKSRLFSRVTLPEGLTVVQVLQKLADGTETPLADLQAAAKDTASLGLPDGVSNLEGYLFPATYDFEPQTKPVDMLRAMVQRSEQSMTQLGVTADERNSVLTEASIVQAEASSTADMAKVARVLDNRLAAGMPLQLDTTVNYANGKGGLTTTAEDRANPSPYNTYLHPGLPPGPISNPGEDAIKAVLTPAQGDWLFFVVVDPDTGETRFARTIEEHQKNVLLFQQWLRDHPGG